MPDAATVQLGVLQEGMMVRRWARWVFLGIVLVAAMVATTAVVERDSLSRLVHGTGDASITEIVSTLEREIFLAGYHKAFGLGCGPCPFCPTCNLEDCTHPDQARPSMEAAGIDVFATARANGYPIEVVTDYSCETNHCGLVLIE